jgi:hypothetical protein
VTEGEEPLAQHRDPIFADHRCPNGLSIQANHEADQGLGVGERLEDVLALIVQRGSADLDKPHVICTSIEDGV